MKKVFLSLITICSIFLLVGCNNNKKHEIIGTWEGKNDTNVLITIEFKEKGKLNYKSERGFESNGKYTVKDNKLSFSLDKWEDDSKQEFEYKIIDNKLSLTPLNGGSYFNEMIKK